MDDKELVLKERITSLTDDELLKMVYVDNEQYHREAIESANEELKKRNLLDPIRQKEIEERVVKIKSTPDNVKEGRQAKSNFDALIAAIFVGCIVGWLSSFFIDKKYISGVVFSTGLAVYFSWSGMKNK